MSIMTQQERTELCNQHVNSPDEFIDFIEQTILAKLVAGVSVEPNYLCESTRFKMSFFQNEDGQGGYVDGTHVTCFEAFEDELDGEWVALVPAENDRHITDFKTAIAAARVQENERCAVVCEADKDFGAAIAIRALIGGPSHG